MSELLKNRKKIYQRCNRKILVLFLVLRQFRFLETLQANFSYPIVSLMWLIQSIMKQFSLK